jgi:hypothetical protein
MTRGHPTCFLCGASARQTALQRVGSLMACTDEEQCIDRQAKRLEGLKAEAAK